MSVAPDRVRRGVCGNYNVALYLDSHEYEAIDRTTGQKNRAPIMPVTTFIKQIDGEEFNAERQAVTSAMSAKYSWTNGDPQVLIRFWNENRDTASRKGTVMHDDLDRLLQLRMQKVNNYRSIFQVSTAPADNFDPIVPMHLRGSPIIMSQRNVSQVMDYFDYRHLEPVATEMLLYSNELLLGGATDALFLNKQTGTYVLVDWKRRNEATGCPGNVRFQKFPGNYCLIPGSPIYGMRGSDYTHGLVQLNTYRGMYTETHPGSPPITELILVSIYPDDFFLPTPIPVDLVLWNKITACRKLQLSQPTTK